MVLGHQVASQVACLPNVRHLGNDLAGNSGRCWPEEWLARSASVQVEDVGY